MSGFIGSGFGVSQSGVRFYIILLMRTMGCGGSVLRPDYPDIAVEEVIRHDQVCESNRMV